MTGSVNMYLYVYLKVLVPLCPGCVYVCDFKLEYWQKSCHLLQTLIIFDAFLHKTLKSTATSLGS